MTSRPLKDRFWEKVRKGPKCWEWTGTTDGNYGLISVNNRMLKAHRVAWELTRGKIPGGKWVLHRCDNRRCVRPIHLFLGTHTDNMRDAAKKGRHWTRLHPELVPRGDKHWTRRNRGRAAAMVRRYMPAAIGESNPFAKLTQAEVTQIRKRRVTGESMQHLAESFGVTRRTIAMIVSRRTWR